MPTLSDAEVNELRDLGIGITNIIADGVIAGDSIPTIKTSIGGWVGCSGGGEPGEFTIGSLFENGENGAWLDMTDNVGMWQDSAGTIPVVADGDPVWRIDDKSGGSFPAISTADTRRPFWNANGYLDVNGGNFVAALTGAVGLGSEASLFFVFSTTDSDHIISGDGDGISLCRAKSGGSATGLNDAVERIYRTFVDGVEVQGILQSDFFDAWADGNKHIVEIRGADCKAFSGIGIFTHDGPTPNIKMNGTAYEVVLREKMTITERENLLTALSDKHGVSVTIGDISEPTTKVAFIIIGQSNAIGSNNANAGVEMRHAAYSEQWDSANGGTIASAKTLLHQNTNGNAIGFGLAFGDSYQSGTGNRIVNIPGAKGSTGFQGGDWNKGDPTYEEAVSRANAFFAANPSITLGGFLWHQGGQDIGTGASGTYEAALDAMIGNMRADVTAATSTTPFILGEMAYDNVAANQPHGDLIQAIINDTPNRVANTAVASAASLTTSDGKHFDAPSQLILGDRYYTTWAGV